MQTRVSVVTLLEMPMARATGRVSYGRPLPPPPKANFVGVWGADLAMPHEIGPQAPWGYEFSVQVQGFNTWCASQTMAGGLAGIPCGCPTLHFGIRCLSCGGALGMSMCGRWLGRRMLVEGEGGGLGARGRWAVGVGLAWEVGGGLGLGGGWWRQLRRWMDALA